MNEQFTWATAVSWANDEIERLRKRNDSPELNPEQTAGLRGELAALKRLIALPEMAARKAQIAAQVLAG